MPFESSGNYKVDQERRNLYRILREKKDALLRLLDLKRDEQKSRGRLSGLGQKGAEAKRRRRQQKDLFD